MERNRSLDEESEQHIEREWMRQTTIGPAHLEDKEGMRVIQNRLLVGGLMIDHKLNFVPVVSISNRKALLFTSSNGAQRKLQRLHPTIILRSYHFRRILPQAVVAPHGEEERAGPSGPVEKLRESCKETKGENQ